MMVGLNRSAFGERELLFTDNWWFWGIVDHCFARQCTTNTPDLKDGRCAVQRFTRANDPILVLAKCSMQNYGLSDVGRAAQAEQLKTTFFSGLHAPRAVYTAWCSEIGSLMSCLHLNYMHPVTP